jgi:DNA helicase IV
MTIHRSKGLEADYVIIPNLKRENKFGFPSGMVDDPVLKVAMPVEEDFEDAEERRLFYVAMTRARKELILVIPGYEKMSKFLVELIDQEKENRHTEGLPRVTTCPRCKEGVLVPREGPYGRFYGCSTFPACMGPSST